MVFANNHKLGVMDPNFVKSGDQTGILTSIGPDKNIISNILWQIFSS
jgi:hypothetical protein